MGRGRRAHAHSPHALSASVKSRMKSPPGLRQNHGRIHRYRCLRALTTRQGHEFTAASHSSMAALSPSRSGLRLSRQILSIQPQRRAVHSSRVLRQVRAALRSRLTECDTQSHCGKLGHAIWTRPCLGARLPNKLCESGPVGRGGSVFVSSHRCAVSSPTLRSKACSDPLSGVEAFCLPRVPLMP